MKKITTIISLVASALLFTGCQQSEAKSPNAGVAKSDEHSAYLDCYGHPIKKVVIYGDSISTRNHGNGGYEAKLKAALNLETVYNYAIGSSGLSTTTPNSMVGLIKQYDKIPADADLIIIWHGTNDWYWGSELGHEGDTAVNTFWGGIGYVITQLRKKLPDARIVWGTPIYRWQAPNLTPHTGEAYALPNALGYTLQDYNIVLEKASQRYGFNLIELGKLTNIHKENEDRYLEDHVHPDAKGYDIISHVFASEIKKVCGL